MQFLTPVAIGTMSDMDPCTVDVEEHYRQAVDAMTPAQKFARMHALLFWVRDFYARQLRDELGEVSDERLRWEVCRRLYSGDRRARELIERKLRDVHS
jgi:hypothetical protein